MPRPSANPYEVGETARTELNARDVEILDFVDEKSDRVANVITLAMLVPTFINSVGSNPGSGGNTLTITRPTGADVEDLLEARVQVWPETATIAPPAGQGWVNIVPKTTSAGGYAIAVYYRIDDGAAGPWVFDTTGASSWRSGGCMAYRNIDTTDPPDATPTAVSSGITVLTVPFTQITTATAGALVRATAYMAVGRTITWNSGGYTLRDTANGDKIQASAGVTGTPNVTVDSHVYATGVLVAYSPTATPSTRAIQASDADALLRIDYPTGTPLNLTLPAAPDGLAVGEAVNIAQVGLGAVTVTPGGGVTMLSETNRTDARTLAGRGVVATLAKTGTNEYMLVGNLSA